jgi:anti-sigma regulatory factor (Ser/Thr protein kinase)
MRTRLSLHNNSADFVRLTEFATEFSRQNKLPDEERARLLIILDELFTNVVEYGYENAASEGHIDVALSLEAVRLMIEFVDDGRPFDPLTKALPDLDVPADERSLGGVGIAIVRALVDEIGYRWDDNCNRLTLGRDVQRPPAIR